MAADESVADENARFALVARPLTDHQGDEACDDPQYLQKNVQPFLCAAWCVVSAGHLKSQVGASNSAAVRTGWYRACKPIHSDTHNEVA